MCHELRRQANMKLIERETETDLGKSKSAGPTMEAVKRRGGIVLRTVRLPADGVVVCEASVRDCSKLLVQVTPRGENAAYIVERKLLLRGNFFGD